VSGPFLGSEGSGDPPVRVLYIAGWGRSGSTLLDRLLGQVPGMVSVGELRQIWFKGIRGGGLCGCLLPFPDCPFWTKVGEEAFGGWDELDLSAVLRLRRHLDRAVRVPKLLAGGRGPEVADYVSLLQRLVQAVLDVSGAKVMVDSSKTPAHALLLGRIPGADVRMVHLVRDSRGVAYSWRRGKEERWARRNKTGKVRGPEEGSEGRDGMGVLAASARWVGYNALTPVLGSFRSSRMRLRYEDLVAEPRLHLRRMLEFAGVPIRADDLSFLHDGRVRLGADHTVHGSNRMRFSVGEIPLRLDDQWRSRMAARDRHLTTVLTWPLLLRFGYPLRLRPWREQPVATDS
jgi:hypothetical protein